MTQATMTQIAYNIGCNDRISRDATLVIAKVYAKADTEQQAQMRRDWMINYVAGNLNTTLAKAERVVDTPRTERNNKQQQSCDRGRQQFKYHVQRDTGSTEPEAATKVWAKIVADISTVRKVAKALEPAQQKQFEAELRELIARYTEE